jgi:hypothetical protein
MATNELFAQADKPFIALKERIARQYEAIKRGKAERSRRSSNIRFRAGHVRIRPQRFSDQSTRNSRQHRLVRAPRVGDDRVAIGVRTSAISNLI